MQFRIFQPTKTPTQSGRRNIKKWLMLPIEETNIRSINTITGWVSASDTSSQLRYEFSCKEDAINFAKESGFKYEVEEPRSVTIKQKSYAANFTN